jgi:hypothetical protein
LVSSLYLVETQPYLIPLRRAMLPSNLPLIFLFNDKYNIIYTRKEQEKVQNKNRYQKYAQPEIH